MSRFILICIFLFFSIHTNAKKTPVIFDTDLAIDDWSALLLLGMHPKINLVGVTANGAGETRCKPAMINIPALLDLTHTNDTLIACGDDFPLEGFFAFPEPWRIQADTLSGVNIPASKRAVSKVHAVEALHTLINQHEDIVVLTTGSLTNLAQLIEKYPKDIKKIKRLVIMGGAFHTKGNIIVPGFTDGHPNKEAEWNIYVDPVAANKVFAADIPTEVVGLDVTNTVQVTKQFAANFKDSVKTPAAEFWDKVLDDNDWFIESGEYYFWDVLAALVVIDEKYCIGPEESVYVEYDFIDPETFFSKSSSLKSVTKGTTKNTKAEKAFDKWTDKKISNKTSEGKNRRHLHPATAGITRIGGKNPKVTVCEKTDAESAFHEFTETLNRLK